MYADRYGFEQHIRNRGFVSFHSGSFRRVYARKNVVIKVPHDEEGEMDNMAEAAAWHKYKSKPTDLGLYLAPCRMLPFGCLMMVLVEPKDGYAPDFDALKWVQNVDRRQVGTYRGRLVAYDYGLDLTERYDWEKEWNKHSKFFHTSWLPARPYLRKDLVYGPHPETA